MVGRRWADRRLVGAHHGRRSAIFRLDHSGGTDWYAASWIFGAISRRCDPTVIKLLPRYDSVVTRLATSPPT